MLIETRIDWGGFVGEKGAVYILMWEKNNPRKKYARKIDGLIIPESTCDRIAQIQQEKYSGDHQTSLD